MTSAIEVIAIGWAIIASAFAAKCYLELWRWARQCQHARIFIAFKRKTVLQAPLVEWLLWTNQLDQDKDSNGRVVYRNAGVTVGITKAVIPPGRIRQAIKRVRRKGATTPPPKQRAMEVVK